MEGLQRALEQSEEAASAFKMEAVQLQEAMLTLERSERARIGLNSNPRCEHSNPKPFNV